MAWAEWMPYAQMNGIDSTKNDDCRQYAHSDWDPAKMRHSFGTEFAAHYSLKTMATASGQHFGETWSAIDCQMETSLASVAYHSHVLVPFVLAS